MVRASVHPSGGLLLILQAPSFEDPPCPCVQVSSAPCPVSSRSVQCLAHGPRVSSAPCPVAPARLCVLPHCPGLCPVALAPFTGGSVPPSAVPGLPCGVPSAAGAVLGRAWGWSLLPLCAVDSVFLSAPALSSLLCWEPPILAQASVPCTLGQSPEPSLLHPVMGRHSRRKLHMGFSGVLVGVFGGAKMLRLG